METSKCMLQLIRYLSPLLFLMILLSCEQSSPPEVKIYGSLEKVMTGNNLSGEVSLSEFEKTKDFYAIGALEDMKGEVMIYDSQPFVTRIEGEKPEISRKYKGYRACLLATAIVHDWQSVQIPDTVQFIEDIEAFVKLKVKEMPERKQALPFKIEGIADFIEWHVINWNAELKKQSHKLLKKNAISGYKQYIGVHVMGFYSEKPGIITHKGSLTHMHVKTMDNHISGHLDILKLKKGEATLYLPDME